MRIEDSNETFRLFYHEQAIKGVEGCHCPVCGAQRDTLWVVVHEIEDEKKERERNS